jgi:2-phosphosulfolactate phosphatase
MNPHAIYIGSFLNLTALSERIIKSEKDLVLVCAGWKDKFNIEDTLFAGAVLDKLKAYYEMPDDAALSAWYLYKQHAHDLESLVRASSHAQRFKLLHMQTDDVSFCLQQDTMTIVPEMQGEFLVNLTPTPSRAQV